MNARPIRIRPATLIVGALLAAGLTGCVERGGGYVSGSAYVGGGAHMEPVFFDQDDYIYYPGYEMYYGERSHRYYYRDGARWVSAPTPHQVSSTVIRTAPSVRIDFHDSPDRHHPDVAKKYPRQWKPAPPPRPPGHGKDKDKGHDDRDRH